MDENKIEENKPAVTESKPDQKYIYMIICFSVLFLVIGFFAGRMKFQKGKLDSVLVKEPATAETAGKEYTQIVHILDNAKHVVEERYYKADGMPASCENGYSIMRKAYDEKGNLIKTSYYDTNDKPYFVEKLGYSFVEMSYDDNGHKIGELYFDAAGNGVTLEGKSFAGVQYEYDDQGNVLVAAYFDTGNNAVLSNEGYHKAVYTYDNEKHKLTERYYDTDDQLVVLPKGYAGIDHEYDEYGNDIRCVYYDADENIAPNRKGPPYP